MEVLDKNGLVKFYQNCLLKFLVRKADPITDLDATSEEGLYTCNASTTTLPGDVTSGRVLVTNSGDAAITQLLLGSNNKVYVRTATNPQDSPLSWGTWGSLLTSEDSSGGSSEDIAQLQQQLSTLQQTVNSNSSTISTVQDTVNDINGKYNNPDNIMIGDSSLSTQIGNIKSTLSGKVDSSSLNNYYTKIDIDSKIGTINSSLSGKVDSSSLNNYYSKTDVDSKIGTINSSLSGKLDSNALDNYYNKTEVEQKVSAVESKLGDYVLNSDVANKANKIPRFNSDGHLVLPSGLEIW